MLNLPFSFSKQKDTSKFLTLSVSSEGVKCLAFHYDGVMCKIIGVGKQSLEPQAVRSGSFIESESIEHAAEIAVTSAIKDLEDKITDVIVGASGDMCFGLMTTARSVRGKTTPTVQDELEELSKKITETAFNEAGNRTMLVTGNSELDLELITTTPVYTKVDEKFTNTPIGVQADTLELAMFSAFSPTFHIKAVQRLTKKLGLKLLAIGADMYSLIESIKYSKGPRLDCVVMDVGSDSTDIGVIFGGGIVSTQSFNIGGKHFTEVIAKNMGITYREAETIKKSYATDKLSQSESIIVHDSLKDILEIWLDAVELTFGQFTGVKTFSPDVYIAGGGALLPDIMDLIKKEPWTHSIPFKTPPDFHHTAMSDLIKVSDSTGKAQSGEFVIPASLSSIYIAMKGTNNG